jgi:hypothetical protein
MHQTGAFFLFWRAVERGRILMRAQRSSSDIERVKIGSEEERIRRKRMGHPLRSSALRNFLTSQSYAGALHLAVFEQLRNMT